MTQLYRRFKKRRNDRGSAIVIVIIAMAMIGILATTLLWMAYMNYMIKVADIRNKNSFYSAEEVVEQIMSGLRQDSAEAVSIAYREVLANWDNLESESNRSHVFTTTYLDALCDKFKLGSDLTRYDRSILESYVDAVNFPRNDPAAVEGVNVAAWDNGNAVGEPAGEPFMEVVANNSVILRNIYVSCTGSDGRLSIVKTDICLDVPKLVFENAGSIDLLYQYILIGNKGVDVKVPGAIKTEGSIYAGTDENGLGGLQVGEDTAAATNLTMENALRVISKGDIKVNPVSKLLVRDVLGQDNRLYAKNITLNGATASFDTKVYVANDLMLDGIGSRVALTKEYYGYGSATDNGLPNADGSPVKDIDSSASSAIIINGRDSTVDMSSVTRLLIAGRSYIGPRTGNAAGDEAAYTNTPGITGARTPVMMGESIAVKGGQVAYLVPAECIGTLEEGEVLIGQNPVNADMEDDEMEEFRNTYGQNDKGEDRFQEVNFKKGVYRLNGKSLSDFGVTDMNHIRKVYAQYQGHSLLYYYLVMDKASAEAYFVQYYDFHANREEIDTYFNRYLSGGFQLGDFEDPKNQYTILGNSLVSSALTDSGVTLLTSVDQTTLFPPENPPGEDEAAGEGADPAQPVDPDAYTESGENAETVENDTAMDVTALSDRIRKEYKSLTYNLTDQNGAIPNFLDPDDTDAYDKDKAAEYVFKSVIREEAVKDYLADVIHANHVTYNSNPANPASGLKAYLTTQDAVSVSSLDSKTRLIVSTGDVTVDRDFTGLIIAKGKITVTGASSIKQGGTELYDALQANSPLWVEDGSGDNHKMIDWFVNGGGMANGAQAPNVDDAGDLLLDYSEIVRYMNWIKK